MGSCFCSTFLMEQIVCMAAASLHSEALQVRSAPASSAKPSSWAKSAQGVKKALCNIRERPALNAMLRAINATAVAFTNVSKASCDT
eukprot:CAMPEP_0177372810 /NCGR_PEP_ID=MMETSP0368-20130122/43255_1 /TAXON_ID=447022 ORGANISM="Scrippsiella hangoei-like, Strain SHHI-4" /NCGR_SAMPLE_ID=MMETSP0368 /ASSEMBLY_ACC=CAM_ASM_000363 /LENGTH=86 /DNA_ID=CAMNT_0018836229 /DNA_START=58 /DNA_END=318 /DNA_ORIENTATION=-